MRRIDTNYSNFHGSYLCKYLNIRRICPYNDKFLDKFLRRLLYIEMSKLRILLYVCLYNYYCKCFYSFLYKNHHNLQ